MQIYIVAAAGVLCRMSCLDRQIKQVISQPVKVAYLTDMPPAFCMQRVVKTRAASNEWYGPDRAKWLGKCAHHLLLRLQISISCNPTIATVQSQMHAASVQM